MSFFGGSNDLNIDSSLYFGEGDLDFASFNGSNGSIGLLERKSVSIFLGLCVFFDLEVSFKF